MLIFPPVASEGHPEYANLEDDTVQFKDHFSELLSHKIQYDDEKGETDSFNFISFYNTFIAGNDRVITVLNNAIN